MTVVVYEDIVSTAYFVSICPLKIYDSVFMGLLNKIEILFQQLLTKFKQPGFNQVQHMPDENFRMLWQDRPLVVASAISDYYELPRDLVLDLLNIDYNAHLNSLSGQKRRNDTLKSKFLGRYIVIEKNGISMDYVSKLFPSVEGRNFLDVGCGMGMAMHHARKLGFNICDGLEVDDSFQKRGKVINHHFSDPKVRYYLSDFLTHKFDTKYDFICFFDVFEHVEDRRKALEITKNLLTDDGIVFIYQGNKKSIEIARNEPHYRVPGLSLLKIEDQIRILANMGKIKSPDDFVVSQWPNLELFSEYEGLNCFLNVSGHNMRGGRAHTSYEKAVSSFNAMINKDEIWTFPGSKKLKKGDKILIQDEIRTLLSEIKKSKDKNGPQFVYQNYLIGSWELILTKRDVLNGAPEFQNITHI